MRKEGENFSQGGGSGDEGFCLEVTSSRFKGVNSQEDRNLLLCLDVILRGWGGVRGDECKGGVDSRGLIHQKTVICYYV